MFQPNPTTTIQEYTTKKGLRYRIQFTHMGARYSKSFDTYEQAQAYVNAHMTNLSTPLTGTSTLTMKQLFAIYLKQFRGTEAKFNKPAQLRMWEEYIGDRTVESLACPRGRATIIQTFKHIRERLRTNSNANRYRTTLSAVFAAGERGELGEEVQDLIITNPVKCIKKLREATRYRRAFTLEEVKRIMEEVKKSYNTQLYPLTRLAFLTGRRRGELGAIKMEWVSIQRRLIVIPAEYTKTKSRDSIIPIRDPEIYDYVVSRQGYDRLFDCGDVKKSFKRACIRAGCEDASFHCLRHTCVTLLSLNGGVETSLYVGHSDPQMTRHYLHSSEQLFELNQATMRSFLEDPNKVVI